MPPIMSACGRIADLTQTFRDFRLVPGEEQACFASSAAQKRPINGHFAVIFEKPRVAVQAQNFCFKSPILRPL
jgi:hypothetical protein